VRLAALVLLCLSGSAAALDLAGERDWARDMARTRDGADLLWLRADGVAFPALWRPEAKRPPQGAAVILPERGTHPDWPRVVGPLRRGLAARGWATLALSLPDRPPWERSLARARARVAAALDHLAARGITNVALVGYGWGALVAADFVARRPERDPVRAVALISLASPDPAELDAPALLARLPLPVLDLFAEQDLPSVLSERRRRRTMAARAEPEGEAPRSPSPRARGLRYAHSGNLAYLQVVVPATGHDYAGRQAWLVKRVGDWLNRVAPGMEVAAP